MKTRYSADYGATFGVQTVGTTVLTGAMDLVRIGPGALAASDDISIATTAGGAYSAYTTLPTDATPAAVVIPRYELGSTSASNTNTTPEYILASSTADDDGYSLYEVTASGATVTNITPNDGTNDGLAVDHRCVAMPWRSGARLAAVLVFGSTRKLIVKTNVGAGSVTCTVRDALSADANAVTYRKGDTTLNELYGTDGGDAWYSGNHGATIVSKDTPASDELQVISVYG